MIRAFQARFVVVAAVAAAGVGCDPPPSVDDAGIEDQACELDLNFDTTGAETPPAGAAGHGILCPSFDVDLWAFEAAAGDIVTLHITMPVGSITAVNPAYKIIKDNGTPDGEPTSFSGEDPARVNNADPTDFTAAHRIETAGRYYVAIQDARFVENGFDIVNEYGIEISLQPDPDANEPNNNEATATPEAAGTFTGQIATTGDEDWYAVTVPAGAQIVDVTVTAVGDRDGTDGADGDEDADSGVDHVVRLVAADGQTDLLAAPLVQPRLANGDLDPAAPVTARLRVRAPGGATAYVVIADDDGEQSQLDAALGAYTVTLTVVANPDVNEGAGANDDAVTATVIASGAQLDAVIATEADQDFYKIAAGAGTTQANPKVLVLTIETNAAISDAYQPQVTILGVDPETDNQACNASCAVCDANKCKEPRLQRFIDSATFRTAYPLRDTQAVFVVVNEANDDAFEEGTGYSIRAEVIDDPDPGEAGDDFLIANLEFAGFANGDDLAAQYDNSIDRARVLSTDYLPTCDDDAVAGDVTCLDLAPVPEPIALGGFPADKRIAADCSDPGMGPRSVTATGRLSYEGDRDYFKIDGLPTRAYFALNLTYAATGAGQTPVELALFVHNANGTVISNTLEAQQTKSGCLSTEDSPGDDVDTGCPDGSICVDTNCWQESDTNATFNSHVFPDSADECSFISNFDEPPYFLEVVDNGINDFDPNVTYTIDVDILCGCPAECNVGGGLETRCQGMPDPT